MSKTQKAITFLTKNRDIQYMQAVHTNDTANFINETGFVPGSLVFQSLRKNTKSIVASNVVSYNQIEGHIKAAIAQNAILVLEVARSQLGYALDENKTMEYIKKIIEKNNCNIPIVVHGDHIQYTTKLFNQKKILADIYEDKTGKHFDENINIENIDREILELTQEKLIQNANEERKAITEIIERLIKAGFTSIAIDASTIFDEVAGDAVMKYYENFGTEAEKLIIELEKSFALSLEWGVKILKYDIEKDKDKFDELKENIIADMKKRNKSDEKIEARIIELERAFGILASEANKHGLIIEEVKIAYDKIMKEIAEATIAGVINEKILNRMSENKKLLLLPNSNAAETAYQLEKIKNILEKNNPEMIDTFGIEVEVGHVDKKVPNPRLGGKMESKMTHPVAVKIVGEYLSQRGLRFDLIATNNGSGHGTEFDKESLVPISQVDKISPFLTEELQVEANRFQASIAQHGTSGSDMDELAELSRKGVIKFNIATNYQQIILNVLSLLHDGYKEDCLMEKIWSDQISLMNGLHEKTRENIKFYAEEFLEDVNNLAPKSNDSLFVEFIKKTFTWGISKGKIKENSSKEDIATVLAKEFKRVFGEMDEKLYKLGTKKKSFLLGCLAQPNKKDDVTTHATSLTAAILTKEGWRGNAKGLDKNFLEQKEEISRIKDESDGLAKKIYERVIKENNIILMTRASEGFGRDEVLESFKANEVIMPDEIIDETDNIKHAIDKGEKIYKAKNGQKYIIENAVIDVIENTNAFVTNVEDKKLEELDFSESGASSIIVTGDGIRSIGNIPDYYADSILTTVKKENVQDFTSSPLDPETTAKDPEKQLNILKRIAESNDLEINDLEVVLMDRRREQERLSSLKKIQKKYPGLEITTIKDGTVAHGILATLGKNNGKHKIMMTVGAAPEGFYNLAIASLFKNEGAIGSLRIYSKNVNKTKEGEKAENLERRYDFDEEEKENIRNLRPKHAEEIIKGKKLFTQNGINGDINASFSFITNNGVFGIKGVQELPQNFYEVTILRISKVEGKPCAWFERKVIGL